MATDWQGRWRNQHGPTVDLTVDEEGRVSGTFRTAVDESGFRGKDVPIAGFANGDVIGFASAAEGGAGPVAVSYTGIFRDGKLAMLWHMVSGHAVTADRAGEVAS